MSGHEKYLTNALKRYRYADNAKQDILNAFQSFKDLRPNLGTFVFNDGSRKELLSLEGTIPVPYKGNTYNIPVQLWLMENHPYDPPMVYLKPTSMMQIKQGKHVDANGKIYLPYLHEWKHPKSDLLGLLEVLIIVFGEEPPIFSRQTRAAGGRVLARPASDLKMSRGKEYLENALSRYQYADMAKQDILNVFQSFNDLRSNLDTFVFNNGSKKELLSLEGTIPVSYKGNTYNIPVQLWLMESHPYNPPMVYVKPTSVMQIKQGKHVDANGKIYLPYLHEWTHPQSDLLGLIQVLTIVFGEEPPIFARQTSAAEGGVLARPASEPSMSMPMPNTEFGNSGYHQPTTSFPNTDDQQPYSFYQQTSVQQTTVTTKIVHYEMRK